jgi:membrane protein YqaA with SNARE-associated domain
MAGTNLIRKSYDWVLGWAEHPAGTWMLFMLAFAEASFFPVPPDVLLIALALGLRRRSLWFAFVCTLGSVLGGIAGYLIGWQFWDLVGQQVVDFYHGQAVMDQVKAWAQHYGFWGVFAAALTPIPYKIFTISAGLFKFNFLSFLVASITGRALRFFVVAGLIQWLGEPIRGFIDRWFNWLALAFVALLIGGVVVIGLF